MLLFLEEKRKEKQKLRVEKMATRPKRKYQTTREQNALLEEFYRELDEEDQLFLGNRFVGEENDTDSDYESDNNEADIATEDLEEEPTIDSNVEDLEVEPLEAVTKQGNDELPTKQKFKNLTEVLNEAKYSDVPAQKKRTFHYSDPKKTVNIAWTTTTKDYTIHRKGTENIRKGKAGSRGIAKNARTPLESLELFLADEMIDKLVIYTNASIQPLLEKFEDLLEDSDKCPHFKLVDRIDMKAFIGILYLRAAFRWNLLDREIIWNHESAHDIFGVTMSVICKFLCRFCTFADKTTRQDRWKNDKFACMREIFEAMNSRNASMRCPSALLTVDETFYPYRGHIGFKQYNPHKPAKYGLLYRSLCDSTVTYTYFSLTYAGKPEVVGGNGAKFYITGTDE